MQERGKPDVGVVSECQCHGEFIGIGARGLGGAGCGVREIRTTLI